MSDNSVFMRYRERQRERAMERMGERENDMGAPFYSAEYKADTNTIRPMKRYRSLTPQDIMSELKKYVVGQDEACRQIAIMMYQHFHGHRSVGIMAGPTGSGKSYIAETLARLFPDVVSLRDVSNVTNDGWSGGKKVGTLFSGLKTGRGINHGIAPLVVLDECDKLFSPKINSGGENVSESVQAEFLSVVHGCELDVKNNKESDTIDTGKCSILFAGAFEKRAMAVAHKESGSSIGFGANHEKVQSYTKDITMEDIHEAGCITELCGRINKLICLAKMDEGIFRRMLDDDSCGPLCELQGEFGLTINLSDEKKEEIAREAWETGLGVRGLKNRLRSYIDEAIWEDCGTDLVDVC